MFNWNRKTFPTGLRRTKLPSVVEPEPPDVSVGSSPHHIPAFDKPYGLYDRLTIMDFQTFFQIKFLPLDNLAVPADVRCVNVGPRSLPLQGLAGSSSYDYYRDTGLAA
jgi:hypothetical protein